MPLFVPKDRKDIDLFHDDRAILFYAKRSDAVSFYVIPNVGRFKSKAQGIKVIWIEGQIKQKNSKRHFLVELEDNKYLHEVWQAVEYLHPTSKVKSWVYDKIKPTLIKVLTEEEADKLMQDSFESIRSFK